MSINNFRLGIQLADAGATADFGKPRNSNWANSRPYWSVVATDGNRYDPDAIRLELDVQQWVTLDPTDIRLGICFCDRGGTGEWGIEQYTPWASEATGSGDASVTEAHASMFATDANAYDPDGVQIVVATRPWPANKPNYELVDLRVGIQLFDQGGTNESGDPRFTPWLREGGGWSAWATDANRYDFDGGVLILEVRVKQNPAQS